MNIKSTKVFVSILVGSLIIWRVIYAVLSMFDIFTPEDGGYINYFMIILIISLTLLITFFLNNFTDYITKSYWVTGTLTLKKVGAFSTFNRAKNYDYQYKTYFKILDKENKEHYLYGMFLPEDCMIIDQCYTVKVRNKKILEIKNESS